MEVPNRNDSNRKIKKRKLTKKAKILLTSLVLGFTASSGVLIYKEYQYRKFQEHQEELKNELESLENQLTREENSLNAIYKTIDSKLTEAEVVSNTTKLKADSCLKATVCSEANRYNNAANEQYLKYCTFVTKIKEELPSYKTRYKNIQSLNSEIIEIQKELNFEEEKYSTITSVSYAEISGECEKIFSQNTTLVKKIEKSQAYADDLYNEYYPLLVKLVTGEAGDKYYSSMDQYCVMNVVENRIKSKHYPNTVKAVVFQKGQYQPTWDGSWSKTPNKRTKQNVQKYLRGKVTTGMPDKVVYQAMFKQGKGVWKHITNSVDTGHYYCY